MLDRIAVAVCALALAACSPKAGEADPGADVARPKNPFFGTWKVETAHVAPWWDQQGPTPEMHADFKDTPITFEPGKASGPKPLTCSDTVYAVSLVTAYALFEGHLHEPAKMAAELGLPERQIQQLNFYCSENNADVSLDFPMADDDTILLGLDNMIYTLKRTK